MAIKYNVEISPVREVTLLGASDLDFWQRRLHPEGLDPTVVDGNAQLLICAIDSQFMGLRFRELSISVFVSRVAGGADRDGAYLVHAFNSRRSFAFIERAFFSTPYYFGELVVDQRIPASLKCRLQGEVVLRAAMGTKVGNDSRTLETIADGGWEGPLFLPDRRGKRSSKLFFAKIAGATQQCTFDPARDELLIKPTAGSPVLTWLLESHFQPQRWEIRTSAVHGKSKTVARSAAGDFSGGEE